MRLLHTRTLKFQDFYESNVPTYAILSHRWESEEITYKEFIKITKTVIDPVPGERQRDNIVENVSGRTFRQLDGSDWQREPYRRILKEMKVDRPSVGLQKVFNFCKYAAWAGCSWAWIDTCCIDKRSSAELSEAINSMYQWYSNASICLVYLADVQARDTPFTVEHLRRSKWFTRGWTLQELLAPELVQFLDKTWNHIGWKDVSPVYRQLDPWRMRHLNLDNDMEAKDRHRYNDLKAVLEKITAIPAMVLRRPTAIHDACIAEKMRWAAKRETSRGEDVAYSLLGIFDVNMPLLYGEGQSKAFVRLQMEILKKSTDESIFAWAPAIDDLEFDKDPWQGLLAPSPSSFIVVRTLNCDSHSGPISRLEELDTLEERVFAMSPRGMQLSCQAYPLAKLPLESIFFVPLNCQVPDGQCVLVVGVLKNNAASKWDGNYSRLLQIVGDGDTSVLYASTTQQVQGYFEQTGFTDSRNTRPPGYLSWVELTHDREHYLWAAAHR